MHLKCVPQNSVLLNFQLIQFIPDDLGRAFEIGIGPAGESVIHLGYARNPFIQQLTFTSKRDPAVAAPARTRCFAAKNKLRDAGEMSCQPGQLYIRAVAGQAVGATVAPWVEQLLRECGLQCIGQSFGQFGIGHQCP